MYRFLAVLVFSFSSIFASVSSANPLPIEYFADRPATEWVSISPSGETIAYIRNQENEQFLVIQTLSDGQIVRATELKDLKPLRVDFITEKYVLVYVSVFKGRDSFVGKGELSRVVSYAVETGKSVQMFENTREVGFQDKIFNLTNVVGLDEDQEHIYMAAYGFGSSRSYDVFKLSLSTGNGDPIIFGDRGLRDYFVDDDGQPILRWFYSNVQNTYRLESWKDRAWHVRLDEADRAIPSGILGVSADGSKAYTGFSDDPWGELFEIDLFGDKNTALRPVLSAPEMETDAVLRNGAGVVIGVRHAGMFPSYSFFDQDLTNDVALFQQRFPGAATVLLDWSDDLDRLLYRVDVAYGPAVYLVHSRSTDAILRAADGQPAIAPDQLGKASPFFYTARDGAKVPAVLTMPAGGMGVEPRPLILMPHGGPESHDRVGYDWMAQAFANRGYIVLQPNFRGSDGFGRAWRNEGRGDWRGIMQTDVLDGISALASMGMIDPNRTCVVGASYGGYSALAIAAFYPDQVQCAVAISPVSDLPKMLSREQAVSGRASWVMQYWTDVIGDWRTEIDRLAEASPARHAENVTAPILLVHGDEDIVVPYGQSALMLDALQEAGKEAEIVKIKNGDHWMSSSRERRETLGAAVSFVEANIPVN